MKTWNVFYPDVLPAVLGCPEPTVDRALLHAAREFCIRTRCWRADLPTITTLADTPDYQLSYPPEADAVEFLGATFGGHDMSLEVMDGTTTEDRIAGNRGGRRLLTWDRRTVTVMPTPAAGVAIIVTALLLPKQDAAGLPNDLADSYRSEIASGALANLLAMPRTEWKDIAAADRHGKLFAKAIGDVKKRVWKAHSSTRPRSIAQFF